MREQIVYLNNHTDTFGIVSMPGNEVYKEDFMVLLLNAGIINHLGPNRLHVRLARAISDMGYLAMRWDYDVIRATDQDMQEYSYQGDRVKEISDVMDAVEHTFRVKRFVLAGICSGADNAYTAALTDKRVIGVISVNGSFMEGDTLNSIFPALEKSIARRYYKKAFMAPYKWLNMIKQGPGHIKQTLHNITSATKEPVPFPRIDFSMLQANLSALQDRNIPLHLVYSDGSIGYEIYIKYLEKQFSNDHIHVKLIKNCDHIFTTAINQDKLVKTIISRIYKIQEKL
jgi:hypothetical protein